MKRDDAHTLTTADGVTVIVRGIINTTRLQDNGFPLEVGGFVLLRFLVFNKIVDILLFSNVMS